MSCFMCCVACSIRQGDHLSGKPSGNLKHVREVSGILLTVRKMSGEKSSHGKVSQNYSLPVEYLHSCRYLVDPVSTSPGYCLA